jgi:hypothetical protein
MVVVVAPVDLVAPVELEAVVGAVPLVCTEACDWFSCEGFGSADWHHPLAGTAKIAAAAAHDTILRIAKPPGAHL